MQYRKNVDSLHLWCVWGRGAPWSSRANSAFGCITFAWAASSHLFLKSVELMCGLVAHVLAGVARGREDWPQKAGGRHDDIVEQAWQKWHTDEPA